MYEYQKNNAGFGQIHDDNVNIFGRGVSVAPPRPPRRYPGIVPSKANIFGSGISVSPARAPSPVVGIDTCATGNCPPLGLGTVEGANGRPWWHYAIAGAGVGLGYIYLRRSAMRRNPEDALLPEEVIRQAAAITIQAGIPTILWGKPGIGKTKWVQGLGEAMAPMNNGKPVKVITVIGSTKDPTDIGGMPDIHGGTFMPSWAKELLERSEDGLRSILFLDEFSSMTPVVHAALLRVVNEKIAGDKSFDPTGELVHIVMAANRKKHGAGAMDLPPPAANRIVHFDWPTPSAYEWAEGMLVGWRSPFYFTLPEDWRKNPLTRRALEEVAAFIKYREGPQNNDKILLVMPEVREVDEEHGGKKTGGAWPSPRSWEMAADALGAAMVAGAPRDVQDKVVEGAVGLTAAVQLTNFRVLEDLPSPEEILRNPDGWDVPRDDNKLFITTNAIVMAVMRKPTVARYEAAWMALEYAMRVTENEAAIVSAVYELAQLKLRPDYKQLKTAAYSKPLVNQLLDALKALGLLAERLEGPRARRRGR